MKIRPAIIWSVIFAPFLIVSLASCVDGGGNSNSGYGGAGGTIRNGWRVASIEQLSTDGDYRSTENFFYEDGRLVQEIRSEYYADSYDGTVDQTTTEYTYKYDGAGRLIQKAYTENRIESGPDGERESSSSYVENYYYDNNGNVIRAERSEGSASQENRAGREYLYENGLLVSMPDEYFYEKKYYYDEKRRIIRIEDDFDTRFYYDDAGKLVKEVKQDKEDGETYITIFRYDEKGRLDHLEFAEKPSLTYRLRYDGNGNPIKIEAYDPVSGAVVPGVTIKWERGPCRSGWFDANTLTPFEKALGFFYKCY